MFWWNLQRLKFDDYRVRRRAIRWLGKSHDKRAIDAVTTALDDRHFLVRKAAARALGDVGREGALGPLIMLAEESFHYAMARIVVHALQKVLDRAATSADAKDLQKAASLSDVSGFCHRHMAGVASAIPGEAEKAANARDTRQSFCALIFSAHAPSKYFLVYRRCRYILRCERADGVQVGERSADPISPATGYEETTIQAGCYQSVVRTIAALLAKI